MEGGGSSAEHEGCDVGRGRNWHVVVQPDKQARQGKTRHGDLTEMIELVLYTYNVCHDVSSRNRIAAEERSRRAESRLRDKKSSPLTAAQHCTGDSGEESWGLEFKLKLFRSDAAVERW